MLTVLGVSCSRSELPELDPPPPLDPPIPPLCTEVQALGNLAPIDLYVMLDSSGSMSAAVASGQPKWNAVKSAIEGFALSEASTGLGMALSFFPVIDFTVPPTCTGDPFICGDPDQCTGQGVCSESLTGCVTDDDCAAAGFPDESCLPVGVCSGDPTQSCLGVPGFECGPGQGVCEEYGYCENRFSCELPDYVDPEVSIKILPEGLTSISNALELKEPGGLTPTLPAIEGVVEQARLAAEQTPDRRPVVVFATDGFPTACDPSIENGLYSEEAIANVASAAKVGSDEGIQTFVIGVFEPETAELAQQNLDLVAKAGGTEKAFIVQTSSGVSGDFQGALEEVRIQASSCLLTIQGLENEPDFDFSTAKALADIADAQVPVEIPRVDAASACADDSLGFFFDVPPEEGARPSAVVLCPSACRLIGNISENPVVLQSCTRDEDAID